MFDFIRLIRVLCTFNFSLTKCEHSNDDFFIITTILHEVKLSRISQFHFPVNAIEEQVFVSTKSLGIKVNYFIAHFKLRKFTGENSFFGPKRITPEKIPFEII